MTRTKALAAALTSCTILLLGACGGSDAPSASDPATSDVPATQPPQSTVPPTAEPTTPTPSATTATASAPTGTLIDFRDADDTGVTLITAADVDKLKGAPSDFKAFIGAELERTSKPEAGCMEPAQISIDLIDSGTWVRGGYFVPDCGGYATLWAKSNGVWKDVWGGQSLVECSTLDLYKIPSRLAGGQCLKGEESVPYSR